MLKFLRRTCSFTMIAMGNFLLPTFWMKTGLQVSIIFLYYSLKVSGVLGETKNPSLIAGPDEDEAAGPMTEEDMEITDSDYNFDLPNPCGIVPQNVNTKTAKAMLKAAILPNKEQQPIGPKNMFQPDPSGDADGIEAGDSVDISPDLEDAEKEEADEFIAIPYPTMSEKPIKERDAGFFQKICMYCIFLNLNMVHL